MAITNKVQFKNGMDVEAYLDSYFRSLGWHVEKMTPHEERVMCLGDRWFSFGSLRLRVEYKSGVQTYYTGNIFLETISVDTQGKPGWVYTCKADFIVYATVLNNRLLIIRPEKLRQIIESLKQQFRTVSTKNNQNDGYRTHGVIVPLEYAEKHIADTVVTLAA